MKKSEKNIIMAKRYEFLKDRMYECDIIDIVNAFDRFLTNNENFTGEDLQSFWNRLAEYNEVDYIDIVELFTFYMANVIEW